MTRKAPTGAKHDRCATHVAHSYPRSGWLCMDDPAREADMVAFADHLAAVAAQHRTIELDRINAYTEPDVLDTAAAYVANWGPNDRGSNGDADAIRARAASWAHGRRDDGIVRQLSDVATYSQSQCEGHAPRDLVQRPEAYRAAIATPALTVVPAARPRCEHCGQLLRKAG